MDATLVGCPVTVCNSNLVVDGNFAAVVRATDPNWRVTPATDGGSLLFYDPANNGGTLPPIGPQTYVNAAGFSALGSEDDTITAVATIPTQVGTKYILNFDLSFAASGPSEDIDFNPSVGAPLTVIYPCGYSMPCTGNTCPSANADYNFYSLSFVATSTTTSLSFGGRSAPGETFLTNIAVCSSVDSTTSITSN